MLFWTPSIVNDRWLVSDLGVMGDARPHISNYIVIRDVTLEACLPLHMSSL
jgi:hypothetical protein